MTQSTADIQAATERRIQLIASGEVVVDPEARRRENRALVLSSLADAGPRGTTVEAVARATDLDRDHAHRLLIGLHREGQVRRLGYGEYAALVPEEEAAYGRAD